ncbi:uncharacterized protein LOC119684084 [Teleopsis dalmanni]|uniref:uncharacterized protein LOC119684084 n=1 Tax=Teleopsis dalmanni TaxID=139649 RepID=UPI0018CD90CA|nr:uncharacterized protein LOC119684084 [Teleopsis dalmanni]
MTRNFLCNEKTGLRHVPHRTIRYMVYAFILISFVLTTSVSSEECGQEEFTKCAEPIEILHLTSEFSIGGAKKEELDKLCHELRKGVRCIQSYTRRCMDLQQRNQFNRLYHGTNQFIRDLCNKGEFQDEYLRHAPCSEIAKKEFETCANQFKETMVFLKPNKNQEAAENNTFVENVKTICCSINELVDCFEDAAKKICGSDAAKFTRELVDKYAHSLTKFPKVSFVLTTSVSSEECGQEEFTKCAEPIEILHLTSEFSIGGAKKEELDKLCQ